MNRQSFVCPVGVFSLVDTSPCLHYNKTIHSSDYEDDWSTSGDRRYHYVDQKQMIFTAASTAIRAMSCLFIGIG